MEEFAQKIKEMKTNSGKPQNVKPGKVLVQKTLKRQQAPAQTPTVETPAKTKSKPKKPKRKTITSPGSADLVGNSQKKGRHDTLAQDGSDHDTPDSGDMSWWACTNM